MNFQINFSDILALVAIIFSAYSIKKTIAFNRRQSEFIETNDKLNKLLIEKEEKEILENKSANVSANFVSIGRNKDRLKVYNSGQNIAHNVRIEVLEGQEMFVDLSSKFPLDRLESQQGVDVIVGRDTLTPNKAKVKIIWDDDFGKNRFNTIILVT